MWTPCIASNMNFPAPLAALGFLAGCGGLFFSFLAILAAFFVKRPRWALLICALVAFGALVYFGLLFGFALSSQEKVLARGQEKYFCEIDCHLAYSVVNVETAPAGNDVVYRITLSTRFDETTISPRRPKDSPLNPSPRVVVLADSRGTQYFPQGLSGTGLVTPLKPGESYTTILTFAVPREAANLRLLVTSPGWPERLLIGDEQTPLHKETWFQLSS